jgi:hypothetical protein
MRCLVCNTKMVLIEAVSADPTTLPGCEHHTFLCSACNNIERRLLFTGAKTKWTRAVEKLVRKQKALKEEQTLASKAPTKRQRSRSPAAADGLPSRSATYPSTVCAHSARFGERQ